MGPQLDSCGRRSRPRRRRLATGRLQWGRNLTVAEGVCGVRVDVDCGAASMGPQLDSCGRFDVPPSSEPPKPALQWGRNLTVVEGVDVRGHDVGVRQLQWGRNLTVAEGPAPLLPRPLCRGASMGPQLDSCGRAGIVISIDLGQYASMGPQLDSCGRRNIDGAGGFLSVSFNGAAT